MNAALLAIEPSPRSRRQRPRATLSRTRTRTLAALVVLACLQSPLASGVHAQGLPGTAPGSQTGDSGGAYTGLASSPEANLFTGVAQTSIPIEVPPGRLGLAPVLALTYSSTAGPSHYGYGWSLPLPRVHRSTKRGVPRYDDSDRFVLEMPGAMVELERIPGSAYGFRAEIESSFLRIGFHDDDNFWKVIDKLGVTFVFGSTADARTGRGISPDETFSWLLQSIEDPAGNRIEFAYRAGGPAATSTGLPQSIRYGANRRIAAAHFAEVAFTWTSLQHAGPPVVSWREGRADILDVRLAAIETTTHGLRARRYDFSHEEDAITADLRLAGATLTAFAENAADDVRLPSTVFVYAPSTSPGWPAVGSAASLGESFEVPDAGYLRYDEKTISIDSADLNGDAIVDRIDTNPRPPVVLLGNGRGFAPARSWNWPTGASAPRVIRKGNDDGELLSNVFDLDGDSFADLVDSSPLSCGAASGMWCVWRGSADGFASTPVRWPSRVSLLRRTSGGGAKIVSDLIDIDADGRLDLVDASVFDAAAGNRFWNVWRNTGAGFAATPLRFSSPVAWLGKSEGARAVYGLFDINADSLPDLVAADPQEGGGSPHWTGYSQWHVYLNHGDGLATTSVAWPIDGGVGSGTGLPNFLNLRAGDGSVIADLFDITGDGRPDLVRRWRPNDPLAAGAIDRCERSCYPPEPEDSAVSDGFCCYNILVYANTGSSFAQPVTWSSPAHGLRADHDSCPYGSWYNCTGAILYDFDFFDFDGDGLVEFVERYTAAGRNGAWLVHPHPSGAAGGGTRPNLLLAMRNGVGGETMLRYGAAAATSDTRLPFAHWVVRERELRDSIFDQAPLRSTFAYRGGLFDTVEREMRGFALVQEVDPVGSIHVREYHQDRRRAGRQHRTTKLAPPPCVANDPDDPADPCSPWRFPLGFTEYEWPPDGPVLLVRQTDVPAHGGVAVENLRRTTGYAYDAYGNVAERRTETPLAATTTTTTAYVHRVLDRTGGLPDRYSVAKPSFVRTLEAGRITPLVERTFEYEWQAAPPGVLASSSTCVTWTDAQCTRWSRRAFSYDSYGNLTVARGPDGATSRTEYDANALFAVRSVDPVGLVTAATTDPRTGRVTETVAPNGNRLHSRHDGLGRLLRTWGPGTSQQSPLRRLEYAPGHLAGSPPRLVVTDAATGTTSAFFDGLGRSVATKTASEEGGRAVSLVSGLRRYDGRGLVVAEALPFNSDDLDATVLDERFDDAPAWLSFRHDSAGRLTETESPDGSIVRVDSSAPGILRTDDANSGSKWPGSVTLEIFDGLGRLLLRDACSVQPAATAPYECPAGTLVRRESWTHDGLGRVEELRTSALGVAAGDAVTRIERDGLGNRMAVFHSNAGTWQFRHDDSGRVVEVVKPDGAVLATAYDAAGRVVRRRGPSSSASYRYHSAGGGTGKLRRVVTRSRLVRIIEDSGYDERGRVATRRRRLSPRGGTGAELTTAYGYDDLDRRISVEYVGWEGEGEGVLYTDYDSHGREVAVWSEAYAYVVAAEYDSTGRLLRTDYGNGISDLAGYEARDNSALSSGFLRCMRTTVTSAAGDGACATSPLDLEDRHYLTYDRIGNLLTAEDPLHAAEDPRHENLRYQYDALGRLAVSGLLATERERFTFDPLGNLTRNGPWTLEYRDAGHPARLTAVRHVDGSVSTVDYDINGRRVRDGRRIFTYDDSDRLAGVTLGDELVSEYGYMDTGERVVSHDVAADLFQLELGDGVRIDGDKLERTIVFAGKPVAVERRTADSRARRSRDRTSRALVPPPERVFLHHDHQRSVRVVTDVSGQAIEYDRFKPFGERRVRLDGGGRPLVQPASRFAYTGHIEEEDTGLLFFGARYYDPRTGSFLTLDPRMQFASPYAYSGGNPVVGRDADGNIFALTGIELLMVAVGTATFIDSVVRTGDLGHSLTAGVFAGFSAYFSSQLSSAVARPLAQTGHSWLQMAASVASDGFQAIEAAEAIEDGRYAGGVVAAGMLAASLIGIESAGDPGPGSSPEENYQRHGIQDRGMIDGKRVIDVNGICATRPGCITNTLVAARENLRVLFGRPAACAGGCEHVAGITKGYLDKGENVRLRCNSFGAIKCLGAIESGGLAASLKSGGLNGSPSLAVEMSGAPLLRPPIYRGVTYQVNLFDPVVWVGTAYAAPFRSDVVLGRNWWVPVPVIVHHSRMYEQSFFDALPEMMP